MSITIILIVIFGGPLSHTVFVTHMAAGSSGSAESQQPREEAQGERGRGRRRRGGGRGRERGEGEEEGPVSGPTKQ